MHQSIPGQSSTLIKSETGDSVHVLDHETLDPGSVVFKAKEGLRYSLRSSGSAAWYLVEDERTGQFFRLGLQEASFLSLIDGKRNLTSVLALHSQYSGESEVTEVIAVEICSFLIEAGLISTEASRSTTRLNKRFSKALRANRLKWINPVCLSISLFSPNRFFEWIHRFTKWIPSWLACVVVFVSIVFGVAELWRHWDDLTVKRLAAYSPLSWLWMLSGWIVVKIVHELGHGIVCKRYGGDIKKCGLLFFMFMPLPFVDVTSSWGFASKWARIAVASGGIIAELFLASIAVLCWAHLGEGGLRYYLEDIILTTMVHTLLFNMNPLMKFDGYYIFSDLFDVPNLSIQGRKFANSLKSKLFFDASVPLVRFERKGWIIALYGIFSQIWIVILTCTIVIAAFNFAPGIGLALALLAFFAALLPLIQFLTTQLRSHGVWRRRRFRRFALTLASISIGAATIIYWLPAPRFLQAPVVIEYEDEVIVRAEIQGFLRSVNSQDLQEVLAGDLIAVIDYPDLAVKKVRLLSDIASERIRQRTLRFEKRLAEEVASTERLKSLELQVLELNDLEAKQRVLAPVDGRVVAVNIEEPIGSLIRTGDAILSIVPKGAVQALAMVDQQQASRISGNNPRAKIISLGADGSVYECRVKNISPRATTLVHHRSLTAPYGGPLEVVRVLDSGESSVEVLGRRDIEVLDLSNTKFGAGFLLTEPRVAVELSFQNPDAMRFLSGAIAIAHIESEGQSLATYLLGRAQYWLQRETRQSHGL